MQPNWSPLIFRHSVRCLVRPIGAVWNTLVFLTETRFVADVLTLLPMCSPTSIAWDRLAYMTIIVTFRIGLALFFKQLSMQCQRIHSAMLNFSNGSQIWNVTMISATAVSQCSGPSQSCVSLSRPRIMAWCVFCSYPGTHTFFRLFNILQLDCPIYFANCFKNNLVCCRLIGGLPSTLAKFNESSLSSSASSASYEISGNGGNPSSLRHQFLRSCWWLEFFHWEAIVRSPRCARCVFSWRSSAGRCWPIDRIVSWRPLRHSQCIWRWWPWSWKLRRWEHLRPAITTLVEVIFLQLWFITWKF